MRNLSCNFFGIVALVSSVFVSTSVLAENWPQDPLKSVMWERMADELMTHGKGPIEFDQRVKVKAPRSAEDQMAIPVMVDASALPNVQKIVVLADLNPINHVLTYEPQGSKPFISFRFKAEQTTPVRAAALTSDGVWHLSGVIVDAAGGGCTAPAVAHSTNDWTSRLAEVRARIWPDGDSSDSRLRVRIQHPMDTGLADGIPAFYVERLEVKNKKGDALGLITIREPVSENPVFTLKTPTMNASAGPLKVEGRDNHGNAFDVKVPVPFKSSTLQNSPVTTKM